MPIRPHSIPSAQRLSMVLLSAQSVLTGWAVVLGWAILTCLVFAPLLGQETSVSSTVKPGEVRLSHSKVYVHVGKVGFGHEHAAVCSLKASTLNLAGPDSTGSWGTLVFDMASFDADGDEARRYIGLGGSTDASTRKQVNENMLGKEVLDVKKYPLAKFNAKRITKLDGLSKRNLTQYKIEGDFTLHGTTKPLEFVADVEIVKGWQHLRGAFTLLQSDYGIKPYKKAFGAVGITDKLEIFGDLFVAP